MADSSILYCGKNVRRNRHPQLNSCMRRLKTSLLTWCITVYIPRSYKYNVCAILACRADWSLYLNLTYSFHSRNEFNKYVGPSHSWHSKNKPPQLPQFLCICLWSPASNGCVVTRNQYYLQPVNHPIILADLAIPDGWMDEWKADCDLDDLASSE